MSSLNNHGAGSIVTPEAVVLDFELAGIASRGMAFAIDALVQIIAFVILAAVAASIGVGSNLVGIIVALVGVMLILLGYPTVMETRNQGRSLGRMVIGTRVVTVEGAPTRFGHSFARALLAIPELLLTLGGIAVGSALISKRGQRLGDMVAGTLVIRERSSKLVTRARVFPAPPSLVAWAATVDTTGLGEDGYRLLRDFLQRSPDMTETGRQALAGELASFTTERLPLHPCPPGASDVGYLQAVVSAAQTEPGRPLAPRLQDRGAGLALPPPIPGTGTGQLAPGTTPPPPMRWPAPPAAAQADALSSSAPDSATLPLINPPTTPPPPQTPAAPNEGGFATPG